MTDNLKVIIFDADGTLIDSSHEGKRRLIQTVREHGYPVPVDINQRIKKSWTIGSSVEHLVAEPFGLSLESAEPIFKEWRQLDVTQPFKLIPGAKLLLSRLARVGFRVALLSSRDRNSLTAILEHHNLNGFHYIFSNEDCRHKKPDSRVFNELFDCLDSSAITENQCLAVGDMPGDFSCARDRGIDFVGVETGLYGKQDLVQVGVRFRDVLPSVLYLEHWLRDRGLL